MPPWAVAREIAFPVESTDLPTPTTIDSSTEARASSFAEMVEPNPSLIRETQPLTVPIPAEGNLPQSGTISSSSIGTSSNVLSLEKISAYKLALIRNSILAIVEMFKDHDQWLDLDVALDVLDSAARMAKINVSSVHDALLRFHNSITVLSLAETAIVSPKILEYRKQLAYSKEKQEIAQLEKQGLEEDLNIERVQEKMQCSLHSVDTERSELAKSEELITSLEEKLASIPDPTRIISNVRLEHAAAQVNLKENLQ
ncbi:uncharacterized protein LOC131226043 [Magnolia sinica]|uniref:uncharacterized protein LOC131226043 n=1 Tax=Magnolia sinica TaxID=86752 RepID=UPI0026596FDD|nr:uncharacterized protein LOC131226043 [Magnolia sinica]